MNRAAMYSSRPRLPSGFVRLSRCVRACFSHLGSGATISSMNSASISELIAVIVFSPAKPDSHQLTADGVEEGNRMLFPECQVAKYLAGGLCVLPGQVPTTERTRMCLESIADRALQPGS